MKEFQKSIEKNDLEGINEALKVVLDGLYADGAWQSTAQSDFCDSSVAVMFGGWLRGHSLSELGESLAVRCLTLICRFPGLGDYGYLCREFLLFMNMADLRLNPDSVLADRIFASLIEALSCYVQFAVSEEAFASDFALIEQTIGDKIKKIQETKNGLPNKNTEYAKLFHEHDQKYHERGPQLLIEIILAEKELRQFLFAGTDVPICYLIYFIALDEAGHFSPIVRQEAINSLRCADEKFLWEKCMKLRGDFFAVHQAAVPILQDSTVFEFAYSICKALYLLGAECEYSTVKEIADAVLETMAEGRDFLYQYPLKISNEGGELILSHQWPSLAYRSMRNIKNNTEKRIITILDYTPPNSRGLPAALFKNKCLALLFIKREYLRHCGTNNEAELRLRLAADALPAFAVPPFVRTQNIAKAKDLIATYMSFLDLYTQNEETHVSQGGQGITRSDITLMLEKHFDLSALTAESLLYAKIMLWYIEPMLSIFRISEANEAALARINEYIEVVYGKPLKQEAAREKAIAVITGENDTITAMNRGLNAETESLWPLLEEGSPQWNRLYDLLVKRYAHRNTLNIWELRGVLYDMQDHCPVPFYFPASAALAKHSQRFISKALQTLEDDFPKLKKVRQRLYDFFYKQLDKGENSLDACGWKENGGECLRRDRQCCSVPYPNECFTGVMCNLKALSCKFWLCSAARARLAATRGGRRFLAKRRRYAYWCQALNIPLKIRCSRRASFDDTAKEPFVDLSSRDWFNYPLKAGQGEPPKAVYKKRKIKMPDEKIDTTVSEWFANFEPPAPEKIRKRNILIRNIVLAILLLIVSVMWVFFNN